MKHVRWLGVGAAAVLSLAAAPLASAAPVVTAPGAAVHVHGSTSRNWSGYADTQSGTYTFVEAKWTEPSYTCDGNAPESSVIWVGLDGWADGTVEQGGTIAICSGTNQGTHFAWWEMYPKNAVQEVFPISVGDKMFASVTYKAGSRKPFDIFVKDQTTGTSLNMLEACTVTPTCDRTSAEWIVESPSFGSQIAYLPKFKPIKFTSGFASQAPNGAGPTAISSFTHVAITMVGAHGNRAVPSALTASGQGFTDKWISSAP